MLRELLQLVLQQSDPAPDERAAALFKDVTTSLPSGETWMAKDEQTGQAFIVADYPAPASLLAELQSRGRVTCPVGLRKPVERYGFRTECRDVEKTTGGGFEVSRSFEKNGRVVGWLAIEGSRIYQLQYMSLGDEMGNRLKRSPPAPGDVRSFLDSFELTDQNTVVAPRH